MTSLLDAEETIVAIASPTSPAIRGVVRLSGHDVGAVLRRLGIDPDRDPESQVAGGTEMGGDSEGVREGSARAPRRPARFPVRFSGEIDVGPPIGPVPISVLWWPTTRSYTGQPAAEFHTIGSLPILTSLVDAAIARGARAARPGEFTMRAFLAGRLDLTQAEAVLGVIEAEQRGTLHHALEQLAGNLSRPLESMRDEVLNLLADVEAGLDFVDEDIEFVSDQAIVSRLRSIGEELERTCQLILRRGGGAANPIIALRGEPNAGKSCLLNRLAGAQAAIVADVPGTTRDVVTIEARIGSQTVTLVDTAGIESVQNEIDRHSQSQALRVSEQACLRLWCVDQSRSDFAQAAQRMRSQAADERRSGVIDIWVATKHDLYPRSDSSDGLASAAHEDWLACSAQTGQGIDRLMQSIRGKLDERDAEETGSVVGTAARCRDSLGNARSAIAEAIRLTVDQEGYELVASEIRNLAQCLGEVTGTVYTDDILDRVFSRFCIGK